MTTQESFTKGRTKCRASLPPLQNQECGVVFYWKCVYGFFNDMGGRSHGYVMMFQRHWTFAFEDEMAAAS